MYLKEKLVAVRKKRFQYRYYLAKNDKTQGNKKYTKNKKG